MKKLLCLIISVIMAVSMTACGYVGGDDNKDDVSDYRNYLYVGNSDNFYAEMYGGKRETPLTVDGVCGKLQDYIKIKVLPKNGYEGEYAYHIGINEEEFDGVLTKQIGSGYYEVTINATELSGDYDLTITLGEKSEKITMVSSVKSDMISGEKARTIAEKELKENIANMTTAEGSTYEVYVKFIEGEVGSKQFYWYVAFLTDKDLCAVLIDPVNEKVVAKRT